MRHLISILLVVGTSHMAVAQEEGKTTKLPQRSRLHLIEMSDQLARYGRESGNALALVVAANLAREAGERQVKRLVEREGGSAVELPSQTLLEEAGRFAKGDPIVLAMVEDVKAAASKGHTLGVSSSFGSVAGSGTDWYRNQPFKAGEYAETKVDALAGGGISLFVYDHQGNLVCKDVSVSARQYCGWTPGAGEKFSIKIENRGTSPVRYKLVTN